MPWRFTAIQDLLTSVTGLEFEECYKSKVHINIQGSEIDFIDLESFKKNKKSSGSISRSCGPGESEVILATD